MFRPRPNYLSHRHKRNQSLGRVYGYFPPNCQSAFTISGDKVWQGLGRLGVCQPREETPQRTFLRCPVLICPISQAMGKLGTSFSSGGVLINETLTQVLLVGAPTHGTSYTWRLGVLQVTRGDAGCPGGSQCCVKIVPCFASW